MIRKFLISVLGLGILLVASGFAYYQALLSLPLDLPEEGVIIDVRKGQTVTSILTNLQDRTILDQAWPAQIYVRQHKLGSSIKAGEFRLPQGTTLPALFAILSSNEQIRHKVTLVEGITFAEARVVLAGNTLLEQSSPNLTDPELLKLIRQNVSVTMIDMGDQKISHPEGLLYPDTYYFHKGDSDLSILVRAHRKLLEVINEEWPKRQKDLPLKSPYEALVLASIVEKETGKPEERSEIAGVFIRRLNKGMRLQTDPTVIYGLGDSYQGNITRRHLKQKTAYNTYRINGLPPTPIALAGRAAIHATLNPKSGKSLYFVAKGDGSHYFSVTISEHNSAVRKYQLKRRADYRSSHQIPQ